ncbi:ATP-binding cassette domain-containing protein [Sphingobacterium sp. HJSM2_6]|uniref:ATP-binding cassette domain-containing protein n=1 Tax=Sphingobacterium sp. HJSM2_6 TaxID=3366264 RepID=UPI003BBFCCF3
MGITVKNLSKYYGKQAALQQLSFSCSKGRIIGFLGPNGAGKSTFMKIATGILVPDEGELNIHGMDIQKDRMKVKKIIGYLPEDNPLYQDLYLLECLAFEADIQQIRHKKKRISEIIALTGLAKEQHKKIHQLSKGYKQRVGLAIAILHDPEVLILDEPTTGLDPNQILEIRQLIQDLSQEKTVILSTHIMQEVEAICDEIIIIHEGKLMTHFEKSKQEELFPGKTLADIFSAFTH